MRSFFLRVATVALALIALPSAADAGWQIAGSVTTTQDSIQDDVGIISYAVYNQASGGNFFTNSGLSTQTLTSLYNSATMTSLASYNYIYVYEVTSAPVTASIINLFIQDDGATAGSTPSSSGGHIMQAATINGTNFIGTPSTSTALSSSFSSGNTGDANFTSESAQGFRTTNAPAMEFTIGGGLSGSTVQSTSILIIGSNDAPKVGNGETGDGGWADGAIPVPSPEPGTFALLGLGLPLLGWGYVRRLRANKAVQAAVAV